MRSLEPTLSRSTLGERATEESPVLHIIQSRPSSWRDLRVNIWIENLCGGCSLQATEIDPAPGGSRFCGALHHLPELLVIVPVDQPNGSGSFA